MMFIEDSIKKVWVYFMKNKYDMFNTLKKWRAIVENDTNLKLRLKYDNVVNTLLMTSS